MKRLEFFVVSLPNSAFTICGWPGCIDLSEPGEQYEWPAAFELRTLSRHHIISVCPRHMPEACEHAARVVRRLTRDTSTAGAREEPLDLKVDLVTMRLNRSGYDVEVRPKHHVAVAPKQGVCERSFFSHLNLAMGCAFVSDNKAQRWIWRLPSEDVEQRSQSIWTVSGGLPTLGVHHR